MKIPEQGMLLRVFVGEQDKWHREPLYQAIVTLAKKEGLAGATAVKGFLGFGKNSRMHTAKLLRLSEDLPIIIEIVDSEEKLLKFISHLDPMVKEGLITTEKVSVVVYRSNEVAE